VRRLWLLEITFVHAKLIHIFVAGMICPMKKLLIAAVALFLLAQPAFAQPAQTQVPQSRQQLMYSYAPIVKAVSPGVVNIYTKKVVQQRVFGPLLSDPLFRRFLEQALPQGLSRERIENSLGSGVIVRPDGLIVTSNHVIEGADEITVVLMDRREFEAKILTTDQRTDLAVLKINATGLSPLALKDSDDIEVGDLVLAIGNPFGVGQSVSSGIISATARTGIGVNDYNYFIQTDAAVNPGNSGGALVTMDGRLAGINSAIYSRDGGNLGIGFAIPSNMLRSVIDAVAKGQKNVVRPWTGITGQDLTPEIAASLGLPAPSGVLISNLHLRSPAKKAGLAIGDVITGINNRTTEDVEALRFRIATMPIGGTATLSVQRNGKPFTAQVSLIAPPEDPPKNETKVTGRNPFAGATIVNLSPAVSEENNLHTDQEGVIILKIDANDLARGVGLRPGDIILQINETPVARVADVSAVIAQKPKVWRVTIKRGDQQIRIAVNGD
jgi:Do/DeqQ family serine protease